MFREKVKPRINWEAVHQQLRFDAVEASCDGAYWTEDTCYHFSADQIDVLEAATQRLHDSCMEVVEKIITSGDYYDRLKIPAKFVPYIEQSWKQQHPSIYGRFDLSYDGHNTPKMLEYNADTPTSLFEASVLQWHWLKGQNKPDQFNSIHEQLITSWSEIKRTHDVPKLYFTTDLDLPEDVITIDYLQDTARQAGINTQSINLIDIGWNSTIRRFVDLQEQPIQGLFKLYPWEHLANDDFADKVIENKTGFMEPAYKMLLSNKAILPVLWEHFPNHENLLPTFRDPGKLQGDYVKKPIFSREGANISIIGKDFTEASEGTYGPGRLCLPAIYQASRIRRTSCGNRLLDCRRCSLWYWHS